MAGSMIRVKSRDGFELDAWHVPASGERKGGVIVIQEIFGLSDHVKEMAGRLAAAGYEALAPSMYDRGAPGWAADAKDVAAALEKGRELAMANGPDNAMNDIGACFDLLHAKGAVFVTGYCYGGSMSWLAATRIADLKGASCYYGGNVPAMAAQAPLCPTICHFGRHDPYIPMEKVEALVGARPEVEVFVYDAGHGFARKGSADYHAPSDALAFQRTLELFGTR